MSIAFNPAGNFSQELNISIHFNSSTNVSTILPFIYSDNCSKITFFKQGVYKSFYKDLVIFIFYSITVLVAAFGNLIVCYVCFVKRPKSTTFVLIANMAGD